MLSQLAFYVNRANGAGTTKLPWQRNRSV